MSERLDIVLFGATGFTGKHAIPILNKLAQARNRNLTWGVAGRSQAKLKEVLLECQEKLVDKPIDEILTIEADTSKPDTLQKMAQQARIIINCVGPFLFHGEQVVQACLEEGTHYVDITGESHFITQMAIKYHQEAETKNVFIISGCGVECIPTDLGIVYLQKQFDGTVNWVETYLKLGGYGYFGGASINFGSWESIVHAVANMRETMVLQKKLYDTPLPKLKPTLDQKLIPHQTEVLGDWNIPFPTADRCTIERSQRFFYEKKNQRPIQAMTYLQLSNLITLGAFIALAIIFGLHSLFSIGRTLLLKFPQFYSFWTITKQPPKEDRIKSTWCKLTIYGQGWKKTTTNPNEEFESDMDQELTVSVYGKNPGYKTTNICAVLAAIKVITETDKIPGKGGILSPGYAFAETSLIDELNENGVTFQIVENES